MQLTEFHFSIDLFKAHGLLSKCQFRDALWHRMNKMTSMFRSFSLFFKAFSCAATKGRVLSNKPTGGCAKVSV